MKPLALLIVVCASSLTGCSTSVDHAGRSTQGFFVPSFDTLWERASIEMRDSGYPPDFEASDRTNKILVSRWDTTLMPFSGKGTREMATLTIHPVEGRDNYWTVEANVIREQNMNIKEPANPRKAEWKNGVRVPEQEGMLVHRIETFFIGYEVSPQFRDRYGMGAGRTVVPPTPPDPNAGAVYQAPGGKCGNGK